jgi:3-methyladenine DNA glycosylase AlkD
MEIDEIISRLEALADPKAVEGMARFGITAKSVSGVSIPHLRKMAKEIGLNQDLALKLWEMENRETRILASMIADPEQFTESLMEEWGADFDSWEVCDQCIMNLFGKTPCAYKKAVEWSAREEEFILRAGFVLMARLAVSDKKAKDETFTRFFPHIEAKAPDERNMVKKAVNWALRQIGKRNLAMNAAAIKLGEKILESDSKSARWIASDALRELRSQAVQERLKKRGG